MKPKLILHIPHSSIEIPLLIGYKVSRDLLDEQIKKLTDWYTDDLFKCRNAVRVQANFSRIFCDVERFSNDEQEVMAKVGMGVLYERGDDGKVIREVDEEIREQILRDYYWPHHNRLSNAVDFQVSSFGRALVLDCHSFPSIPHKCALDQRRDRPDFNIGTDPFHTPQVIVDFAVSFFRESGYSLGVDWPYTGSIVPLKHYQQNKRVCSIMLEVNRQLYMDESTLTKSKNYKDVKGLIHEFANQLFSVGMMGEMS